MLLYISVIVGTAVLIAILNIVLTSSVWWAIVLIVLGATLFQFLIDGFFALIVNALPDKWFTMNKRCFQVSKRSRRIYEKLGIRKWKDKVWELGCLGGFKKNKLKQPYSPEYVEKFIVESNKGVVAHLVGGIMGFYVILVFPFKFALSIGMPVAITNLFLNILPIMVLRYNVPKLKSLHKRLSQNP